MHRPLGGIVLATLGGLGRKLALQSARSLGVLGAILGDLGLVLGWSWGGLEGNLGGLLGQKTRQEAPKGAPE